jgi:hypothetical protein
MIYTFRNTETDEITDVTMRLSEYDEYVKTNPHLERYFSVENFPGYGDAMRMSVPGVGQPDGRFEREIIGRIKEKVPGNTVKDFHKTKAPREW